MSRQKNLDWVPTTRFILLLLPTASHISAASLPTHYHARAYHIHPPIPPPLCFSAPLRRTTHAILYQVLSNIQASMATVSRLFLESALRRSSVSLEPLHPSEVNCVPEKKRFVIGRQCVRAVGGISGVIHLCYFCPRV